MVWFKRVQRFRIDSDKYLRASTMVAAVRSKLGSLGAEFVGFEGKRVRGRGLFIGGRLGGGVKKSVRIGDISGQFLS
jgi:hypothetical protein